MWADLSQYSKESFILIQTLEQLEDWQNWGACSDCKEYGVQL